jgi:UDP-glucose 4-epimerase
MEMKMKKKVLVTGGAGYIGSHTVLALIQADFEVVILDNLSNSYETVLDNIAEISGVKPTLIIGDLADSGILDKIFTYHKIKAVFHFAGLKAVGESSKDPLRYYDNNVSSTVNLLKSMKKHNIFSLIFSSSATVYGNTKKMPIREDNELEKPTNPYGHTKLFIEQILQDLSVSDSRWNIAILRYFNPIGAHESGLIGEHPQGVPNNLVPYISKVAQGDFPELLVFGNDHPTRDGTGVRDYIHVVDLAEGHIKALQAIDLSGGVKVWNLGTGVGYSVLEIINAFEAVSQKKIPYRIAKRRAGDVAECWSDPAKAELELNWKATRNLSDMLSDVWRWQRKFPNGYVFQ